jgi:hypothetical protein
VSEVSSRGSSRTILGGSEGRLLLFVFLLLIWERLLVASVNHIAAIGWVAVFFAILLKLPKPPYSFSRSDLRIPASSAGMRPLGTAYSIVCHILTQPLNALRVGEVLLLAFGQVLIALVLTMQTPPM